MRTVTTHPFLGGAVALAVVTGCSMPAETPSGEDDASRNESVATVGATTITAHEFARRMATVESDPDVRTAIDSQAGVAEQLRAGVLAQMIDAALIAEQAANLGISVDDADVQGYIDEISSTHLGRDPGAWRAFLDAKGYPEDEVREQLREDLRRERLEDHIAPDPDVGAADIRASYAEGYREAPGPPHPGR